MMSNMSYYGSQKMAMLCLRITVWPHLLNWEETFADFRDIELTVHLFVYRSIVRDDEGVILIAPPGFQ